VSIARYIIAARIEMSLYTNRFLDYQNVSDAKPPLLFVISPSFMDASTLTVNTASPNAISSNAKKNYVNLEEDASPGARRRPRRAQIALMPPTDASEAIASSTTTAQARLTSARSIRLINSFGRRARQAKMPLFHHFIHGSLPGSMQFGYIRLKQILSLTRLLV
jgi:hypothetical protein